MKAFATEIAEAMAVSKRAVNIRASKERWPFVTDLDKGGQIKIYLSRLLPEDVRIALAKHKATNGGLIGLPGTGAGIEAGLNVRRKQAEAAERERIERERRHAAFAKLPADRQATAYARRDVLRACDGFLAAAAVNNRKRGLAEFCGLYNDGSVRMPERVREQVGRLSVSTVMRWQRDYNQAGLMGLANGYCNPRRGSTSLAEEHQKFAISMLVHHPHCTVQAINDGMHARFKGQTPHIAAIRRFVNRWKDQNSSLLLYLRNPDEWRSKRQLAVGDADEQVERLNQRWEYDSTPADVMLADGRHCLVGVIDVYSKRFKLLVSKSSRATAVAALTRRAILDWGVPEEAKTDNGSDYVSRHMVGVFEALGIEQILCPPFTPEAKPHIERAFRTFSHGIAELLPGYIGHSVADRKAIEARRSFADRLMKRAAPGEQPEPIEVNMTAEELQILVDRWCEAIYHQNKHRGLDGKTPAEVARAWQGTERRIKHERALDVLLAEAPAGDGTRVVTKKGVQFDNRYYIADEMAGLAGETVRIKLDPTDLGTIYLFGEDGGFICAAIDPLRTGHDRAEIAARTRALQKRIVTEGARELRKIAREQATRTIHNEILDYREAQIASIVELPKKSEEYTTPALEEAAKAIDAIDASRRADREMEDIAADASIYVPMEDRISLAKSTPEKKVALIFTDGDRYLNIRATAEQKGCMTVANAKWLDEFYQTPSGRFYYNNEGDIRKRLPIRIISEGAAEG
ncbi:MAG: Mu transposase C-terminal domain-containing protein [Desulfobulbaceae bacterium]